jgi:hypothetical protein
MMLSLSATRFLICYVKKSVAETQELYEAFSIELLRIWTWPLIAAMMGEMDLDDLPDLIKAMDE